MENWKWTSKLVVIRNTRYTRGCWLKWWYYYAKRSLAATARSTAAAVNVGIPFETRICRRRHDSGAPTRTSLQTIFLLERKSLEVTRKVYHTFRILLAMFLYHVTMGHVSHPKKGQMLNMTPPSIGNYISI